MLQPVPPQVGRWLRAGAVLTGMALICCATGPGQATAVLLALASISVFTAAHLAAAPGPPSAPQRRTPAAASSPRPDRMPGPGRATGSWVSR